MVLLINDSDELNTINCPLLRVLGPTKVSVAEPVISVNKKPTYKWAFLCYFN